MKKRAADSSWQPGQYIALCTVIEVTQCGGRIELIK